MTRHRATSEPTQLVGDPYVADEYDARPTFEARLGAAAKRRAKRLLQRVIRAVLGLVGTVSSARILPRRPLHLGDSHIRRILVIRTDLIGDMVLSLPAIHAMRRAYPAAEIDVLALPSSAPVLAGVSDITRVVTYDPNTWRNPTSLLSPRNWRQVRELLVGLRASDYDLCLSLAGDWASVLAWFSGAKRRVGFSGEAYPGLMTDPIPGGRYHVRQHEVRYIRSLARAAGGIVGDDDLPVLSIHEPAVLSLDAVMVRAGVPASRPLIALHAGARNGMAKRWPSTHWAELADLLTTRLGATVVLTGAPGEQEIAHRIASATRATIHDLTGKTTLPELVALLARCDLVISGDSGPMHIACAVSTPVIGLFGPTDPQISGPLAPDAIIMRQAIWCAPCYDASATADCRFHNPVCMKSISAHSVFAAAHRQLARTTPLAPRREQADGEEATSVTPSAKQAPRR